MRRAELQALARAKRDDASLLLESGRYSNAYYLGGYAAELALKAVIARQFSVDTIPDKAFVNAIYVHDLKKLVALAGLTQQMQEREAADVAFAGNWALVAQWTEASRYQATDQYTAQITMAALTDNHSGVFPWIEAYW
jgi:hypothetical protein